MNLNQLENYEKFTKIDIRCCNMPRSIILQSYFYVKLNISGDPLRGIKTKTAPNCLNPEWSDLVLFELLNSDSNRIFYFLQDIRLEASINSNLGIEVRDRGRPSIWHIIGQAVYPISEFEKVARLRQVINYIFGYNFNTL